MNLYFTGTEVAMDASFVDLNGNPTDPDQVNAYMMTPDGNVEDISPTVIQNGTGSWSAMYVPIMNGLHQYRIMGSGTLYASVESAFMAQTAFGESYRSWPSTGSGVMTSDPQGAQ